MLVIYVEDLILACLLVGFYCLYMKNKMLLQE